jgi:hypothetical protein
MDYNARFYDPALGKFISADTIVPNLGNSQSLNRYSYAYDNPLRYTDPSGHGPLDDTWLQEFRDATGRDPTWEDEVIRLFSIAYPDEEDAAGNQFEALLGYLFMPHFSPHQTRRGDMILDLLHNNGYGFT